MAMIPRCAQRERVRGFSLIELLVVMGIISVLSGIVLVRHVTFRSIITLHSLAYEIALAVREAQVYGLGIREYKPIGPALAFDIGYGIHMTTATPTSFFLFADVNQDRNFDFGIDGVVRTYSLTNGHVITTLCAGPNVNDGCGITNLDIVFERPDPQAYINLTNGTATVRIASPQGHIRTIATYVTGQIAVQ